MWPAFLPNEMQYCQTCYNDLDDPADGPRFHNMASESDYEDVASQQSFSLSSWQNVDADEVASQASSFNVVDAASCHDDWDNSSSCSSNLMARMQKQLAAAAASSASSAEAIGQGDPAASKGATVQLQIQEQQQMLQLPMGEAVANSRAAAAAPIAIAGLKQMRIDEKLPAIHEDDTANSPRPLRDPYAPRPSGSSIHGFYPDAPTTSSDGASVKANAGSDADDNDDPLPSVVMVKVVGRMVEGRVQLFKAGQ